MSKDFLKVTYDSQKKIWKSENYPYKNLTNRSVGEAFLQSMRSLSPFKVLEYHYDVEKEKQVKDIYQESIMVAKNLQRLGMNRGDVIILFSGYNYMTSALTFGTLLMAGVVNFFEVKLENENIINMFKILQPFMILYEEVFREKVMKSLKHERPKSLKYIMAIDSLKTPNVLCELVKANETLDFDKFESAVIENPQLEIGFLVLTSGSTGLPKITQLTHSLLLNGVYVWWHNNLNYEPIDKNSILFSASPLRWISQVELLLQSAILGIKRICSNKTATGAYGLEILRKTKPSHIFAVPSFFYELLLQLKHDDKQSLNSLKYVQLGGEAPSSVIINLCKKHATNCKLFYSYGMSEVSCSITNDQCISGGKLQSGFEMQVLDEHLQPLGLNKRGQLAVKTPYPFVGYRGLDNKKYFLENGFFLNGDYGYFDDSNTLHFLARLNDLIKFQNIVLIPNLVESLVLNIPEVSTAVLIGYRCTAGHPYEVAALFVVLKSGVSSSHSKISLKIHDAWCGVLSVDEMLLIEDIYYERSFPLTTCGKIDRIALKKIAIANHNLNNCKKI